jgi:proteasome lid subunit RPN8/RPN11
MNKNIKLTGKDSTLPLTEHVLPQNIIKIGDHVDENKNIYIAQPVYKSIHKFVRDKTINESGGMLIGNVVEELGKTNIIINGFIEGKYCEATPTTLKFTHETWEYCHKKINKKYTDQKILGWIHTHPDFGIFLSEYDKFIQSNFFKEDYQIALVVDPIQNSEGFYFWINRNIERCKGFYIFDKTGKKITISEINEAEESVVKKDISPISLSRITTVILMFLIIILIFLQIDLHNKYNILHKNQEFIITNTDIYINQLNRKIALLQDKLLNSSDNNEKDENNLN